MGGRIKVSITAVHARLPRTIYSQPYPRLLTKSALGEYRNWPNDLVPVMDTSRWCREQHLPLLYYGVATRVHVYS